MEVVVERCAALDVHKDTVMACVRRPGNGSKRGHEVREFRTFTSTLRDLRDWLAAEGWVRVVRLLMAMPGAGCGRGQGGGTRGCSAVEFLRLDRWFERVDRARCCFRWRVGGGGSDRTR